MPKRPRRRSEVRRSSNEIAWPPAPKWSLEDGTAMIINQVEWSDVRRSYSRVGGEKRRINRLNRRTEDLQDRLCFPFFFFAATPECAAEAISGSRRLHRNARYPSTTHGAYRRSGGARIFDVVRGDYCPNDIVHQAHPNGQGSGSHLDHNGDAIAPAVRCRQNANIVVTRLELAKYLPCPGLVIEQPSRGQAALQPVGTGVRSAHRVEQELSGVAGQDF